MAGYIEGVDRRQATLFPEKLDDLVALDGAVRVLDGFVAGLDLVSLGFVRATAAGVGRPGYRPGDLLRLYLYGYMNGVRSSRGLARESVRNLEVAWLVRRLQPDFKTIADFRRDNAQAIGAVAQAFVQFCVAQGLARPAVVAIDGSQFFAVSSRKKRQKREEVEAEIAAHEAEIERYLADVAEADARDEEAVAQEKAAVLGALAELEAQAERKRQALDESKSKKVVVDEPEAVFFGRSGFSRDYRQPSYNVQLAVDAESQLILSHKVHCNPSDRGQLTQMAKRLQKLLPQNRKRTLVADAGYVSGTDVQACEERNASVALPVGHYRNPHGDYFSRDQFRYDADANVMVCPAVKTLKPLPQPSKDGAVVFKALKSDCAACPLKTQCTKAPSRTVHRIAGQDALDRAEQRLRAFPELRAMRKQSVEPVFGTLKRWMHGGRFLLKHRTGAHIETALIATAFNIKRMVNRHGADKVIAALAA